MVDARRGLESFQPNTELTKVWGSELVALLSNVSGLWRGFAVGEGLGESASGSSDWVRQFSEKTHSCP